MNKSLATIVIGLALTGCSSKPKWEGPFGLQNGLTLKEVQSVMKFDEHRSYDDMDILET